MGSLLFADFFSAFLVVGCLKNGIDMAKLR